MDNPLREGLDDTLTPDPSMIVIFGITGDLAARKLLPALYNLAHENMLPEPFTIVGIGRRDWSDEKFRDEMLNNIKEHSRTDLNDTIWKQFAASLYYIRAEDEDDYPAMRERLDQLDEECGTRQNRLFYLAIPPDAYTGIVANLGKVGLNQSEGFTRIIVEKPFGKDLDTARELNHCLRQVFNESQIYRIDHYLGKETVQNIAVFRFSNAIFEPLWNRKYIDHVQITVAESIGVGSRGKYYDESGALRDIIQNHVLQVLSLVAMEPPVAWEANAIHDEKVKLLRAIQPITPEQVSQFSVRGQYAEGHVEGKRIQGYLQTSDVPADSTTETYVGMKLLINNWRWAGVPFYVRTGKALAKRVTEVYVEFQESPLPMFGTSGANRLILRIQPDEGITMRFNAKLPGQAIKLRDVNMDFRYGTSFGVPTPEAYERLLLDALLGDSKLFTRDDEVEVAWALMTPFLEGWQRSGIERLPQYEAGSWGPDEADEWIRRDGRAWRRL